MVKTTLKIDGMMCGMCESHVNDAIRNAFPVKEGHFFSLKGRNRDNKRGGTFRRQDQRGYAANGLRA